MPATRTVPLRLLNPSLIRVRAAVNDIVSKSGGPTNPADRNRVSATLRFEAYSAIDGEETPIRFDARECSVFCDGDGTPPVQLDFRGNRYTGTVPRGRLFPDGLPNYYFFRLSTGKRNYAIARVPVVQRVTIANPRKNSLHFADVDVAVTMRCPSWPVLWDNTDPHYQFDHSETVTLTELVGDETVRVVGERTVASVHDESIAFATTPVPPYANSGSGGAIYCVTQYRSNYLTQGPSEFSLDGWTSSATATPVPIRWRL